MKFAEIKIIIKEIFFIIIIPLILEWVLLKNLTTEDTEKIFSAMGGSDNVGNINELRGILFYPLCVLCGFIFYPRFS